jgi:hypothetical protein
VVTEDPLNTAYMINGQTKYHMPLNRTVFSVVMKPKGKFGDIAIPTAFLLYTKVALGQCLRYERLLPGSCINDVSVPPI